jgi:uncharacterized protein (TIGR00251 family)
MILSPHPEGVVLTVHAHAGAKRNEIRGEQDGALKVCVTQAPEKGKANKAIRKLLADSFRIKPSQIELLSGETNPQKKFLIRDVDVERFSVPLPNTEPLKPNTAPHADATPSS